jgi:hypothetical protein
MGSAPQQPESSSEDSAKAIIALLKGNGHYIEQKFAGSRADDVTASYLRKIISNINALIDVTKDRKLKTKLRDIQNHCYAAIMNSKEPQNRVHYFQELRVITNALLSL